MYGEKILPAGRMVVLHVTKSLRKLVPELLELAENYTDMYHVPYSERNKTIKIHYVTDVKMIAIITI